MQLNIRQTSSLWQNINFVNKLEDISNYTLKKVLKKHNFLHLEIDLNLTDDEQIAALNKASRGVDKPTNVLSFQYIDWQQKQFLSHEYLGEIAISFQTVEKEAAQFNTSFESHFFHVFLHGLLHLLGYDHGHDEEEFAMKKLEFEILNYFAIIPSMYN